MKSKKETLFSLAPNINLEDDAHYKVYEAYLDSALKNQIDNLAITGKYGSGKSSIVDTYFHNKEDVLKVSFSTFESFKENGKPKSEPNSDTKGIVFANIINQIIYQIDPKAIPLTRFKLKKPLSFMAKSVLALEIVLILSQIVIPKRDGISFFILSMIIFLISAILGFIILWQLFTRIELKNFKFSVKPVDAEIDIKSDELFEKYTDEIIYLFRKSEKSIFIIEDLDRFGDLSIFEKLRELNIKLNAIEHWTFIYLIKDDLFLNKTDRVKFFDQIIPVIPFITTNNSFDKLREIFSKKVIDNRLLRILSQFIDDYRLLLNIHNEYEVYSKVASLNQNSDIEKQQNELLALIAYKNLYPNHFDDIQNGKGLLNEIVSNYKDDIKIEIDDVSQKIQSLKEKKDSSALNKESELLYVWANENNFVFFESGTG